MEQTVGYHRMGISMTGVVAVIVCIIILFAVSISILNSWFWSMAARSEDALQIRQIHQSWVTFARQFDGEYPTPSLFGKGDEDVAENTTANLFSACIMANYFSPELCVGVTEPREDIRRIRVKEDFNWDLYNPIDGVFWDDTFAADLETGSNVSFAHMPIFGPNREKHWRGTKVVDLPDRFPILGNRGPLGGIDDPTSMTYRIYRPYDAWCGNICFNDGHTEFLDTFNPTGLDNIFAWDCGGPAGEDAMITFTKAMTEDGPVIQHD